LFAAEHTDDTLLYLDATFRDWDTYTRQHRDGLIDKEEWRSQKMIWRGLLSDEGVRRHWEHRSKGYSPELQEVLPTNDDRPISCRDGRRPRACPTRHP
jgi:hypothetical protein